MKPQTPAEQSFDLDRRQGLPAELLLLLQRHPRSGWAGHAGLGMMGQFWLDRHAAFRRLGKTLQDDAEAFRRQRSAVEDFAPPFTRRLQLFLGELHGHHQVEEHHYFPAFRRAEPRLAPGFDLLDRDHETLHTRLVATAEAANALLQALARDPQAAAQAPLENYAAVSDSLVSAMLRHLDDEEDLVIALLLERGEAGLAP